MKIKSFLPIVAALALIGGGSSVHADTYQINFDSVVAYDDGDNKPDGDGEIKFTIKVNGIKVYKTRGRVELSDKGNDTKDLDFSRKFEVEENESLTVKISADEYDGGSSNERCTGKEIVNKRKLGDQVIDCGKKNGDLGLYLYYYVKKVK